MNKSVLRQTRSSKGYNVGISHSNINRLVYIKLEHGTYGS